MHLKEESVILYPFRNLFDRADLCDEHLDRCMVMSRGRHKNCPTRCVGRGGRFRGNHIRRTVGS